MIVTPAGPKSWRAERMDVTSSKPEGTDGATTLADGRMLESAGSGTGAEGRAFVAPSRSDPAERFLFLEISSSDAGCSFTCGDFVKRMPSDK